MKFLKSTMVAVTLSLGMVSAASADSFTLRIGSGHPAPTPYVFGLQEYFVPTVTKRIADETDHKVRFIEAYGGKIANVFDTLEAIEKGLLDIGAYCVCFETSKLLPWNFDYFLPFTTSDVRLSNKLKSEIVENHPELKEMLGNYNQSYLPGMTGFDDYGIGTVEPWSSPEELKGKKIVAAGPNLPWATLFGVLPVTSSLPQMYNDMQTGVAEGTIIFPSAHGGSYKFFEVAPYWTVTGFGAMNQNMLAINNDTKAKLPQEIMDIITEEAANYSVWANDYAYEWYEKGLKVISEEGSKRGIDNAVTELSMEGRKVWATVLKDWPNERANDIISEYGIDAAAIMNDYMDLAEKEGHVWPVRYEISKN
jgi:TRAP-type C4-dicarboxylate transport system substrate-binding protein